MRNRCSNPNNRNFKNYGGRGITVCERWNSFDNFAADMGEPGAGQWLDRIDVNGNYEPANCRWVDDMENGRNQRKTRFLTINGETHHLAEWERKTGIAGATILSRHEAGLPASEVLDPNRKQRTTKGRKGAGRPSRAAMAEKLAQAKRNLEMQ